MHFKAAVIILGAGVALVGTTITLVASLVRQPQHRPTPRILTPKKLDFPEDQSHIQGVNHYTDRDDPC